MKVESAKTWIRRSRKREVKDHGYNFNLDDKKEGKRKAHFKGEIMDSVLRL